MQINLKRASPWMSRVRVRDYKSIAGCDVAVGPLTLLVGPNGAGKSNFLDALAFVADAVTTTPHQAIETRKRLSEILRRVPEPAQSFSVVLDFVRDRGRDESEWERWTYGFEIAPASGSSAAFEVRWEECRMTRGPERTAGFRVERGIVGHPDRYRGAAVEPGNLFVPTIGTVSPRLSQLTGTLRGMRFYDIDTSTLRLPQPSVERAVLGRRGEHLGDVLGDLLTTYPEVKARVDDYMAAVAPGVTGIERQTAGRYVTVEMRQRTEVGAEARFGPDAVSDGTIRAAGVLAALFQPPVRDRHINLVGIETPEAGLHPAAADALYDALTEAAESVQVIATTQSNSWLDRDDIDPDSVLAFANSAGATIIGPLDATRRRLIQDGLYTVGRTT
ncbi:AAA family ATPase [Micromonospora zhanjiangensis]